MILDISDCEFKHIFQDKSFYLPIRWTGDDYYQYLEKLLNKYCFAVESYMGLQFEEQIQRICRLLTKSIGKYLEGFPAKAYDVFKCLMELLLENPLRVYKKSIYEILDNYNDRLNLHVLQLKYQHLLYPELSDREV